VINKLLEYAKKQKIDLEIAVIKNDEITIEYLNERLNTYKVQDIIKYRLTAIINGSSITLDTLDISDPKKIIDALYFAREMTDEKNGTSLAEKIIVDDSLRRKVEINTSEIKRNLLNLNKELKEKYPQIFSIRSEYNFEKDEYEIHNTNEVNLFDSNYHSYYAIEAVLKICDKNISCDKFVIAKEVDFNDFKKKIESAIEDAIRKNNSTSIGTNKYNIVLSNYSVFKLLEAFIFDFHAQNIRVKQSAFCEKLGEQVFSSKVTIVEDACNKDLVGTRQFDDDGVKTYKKNIIEDGVFKTELYNKKYAKKDNTVSTGNSFGVRNMYLLPGSNTENDLIKALNKGIYIERLMGLHSGINHLTGDISVQCEGFLIENGQKTKALNQIILSTNIFELFNNIDEIANNLEFFGSNGGAPSILAKNITIAGKEV